MAEPYLGQIMVVAFDFAPRGWAFCNGQLLPINQNQALFSILGTTYGGNGQTTFALPDLRGATAAHVDATSAYVLGVKGGKETHALTSAEMPTHTHTARASSAAATSASPTNAAWADTRSQSLYAATSDTAMAPGALQAVGGSQPHNNMPPYLVLNVVIALQGIFPSRN